MLVIAGGVVFGAGVVVGLVMGVVLIDRIDRLVRVGSSPPVEEVEERSEVGDEEAVKEMAESEVRMTDIIAKQLEVDRLRKRTSVRANQKVMMGPFGGAERMRVKLKEEQNG